MRIADKMQFEQVQKNIGKNRSQMSELQNQAATQKRVTKPSDDPMAASRVLGNKIDLQSNKQFGNNLNYAKGYLESTDQSLSELGELLVRAKELAIGQSNDGSANEESRRAVAMELDQLQNQMVAIGNRKIGDRFIFGGYQTQGAPFDHEGHYLGDAGEMMVHVDKESFVPMNIPGGRIFLGEGIGRDGNVIAPPPQARTIEELEKRRDMPESSAPAAPTAAGAELRGPASVLEEEQHSSSLNAEQGAPDSTGINLFHMMKGLTIALVANDKMGVQDTLETLDSALQQVVLTRAQVGARSNVIDNFAQTMEKQKVENKVSISNLEDADVYSTVSDINKAQSTLQATLETSGKLIQPSLMSFLR